MSSPQGDQPPQPNLRQQPRQDRQRQREREALMEPRPVRRGRVRPNAPQPQSPPGGEGGRRRTRRRKRSTKKRRM